MSGQLRSNSLKFSSSSSSSSPFSFFCSSSSVSSSSSLGAKLDVLSGGQGGCCCLKSVLAISLPNWLIYRPPSSTLRRPTSNKHTTPTPSYHDTFSSVHTLSLSLCPLFIYLYLSLSLWLGVKMPAARSTGDKSDLPGRVIVKHPPGRLRPPHPFNSSAGIASQERRRVLHAAA